MSHKSYFYPANAQLICEVKVRHLLTDPYYCYFAKPESNVIVEGPAGSFKTVAGMMVDLVRTGGTRKALDGHTAGFEGPIIAASMKGDLAEETLYFRKSLGPVAVYDPCEVAPTLDKYRVGWNPLDEVNSSATAALLAEAFAQSSRQGAEGNMSYFSDQAVLALQPLLLAAHIAGASFREFFKWTREITAEGTSGRAKSQGAMTDATPYARKVLTILADAEEEAAVSNLQQVLTKAEGEASGLWGTVAAALAPFSLEPVMAATEVKEGFKMIDWHTHLTTPYATLFIVAPDAQQYSTKLRPAFATLFTTAVERAQRIANNSVESPGKLPYDLYFLIDEACNVGLPASLGAVLSTTRSYRIRWRLAIQDRSQLEAMFGQNGMDTILTNCQCKVFLPGITNQKTLDYMAHFMPRILTNKVSTNKNTNQDGTGSSVSEETGESATKDALRQLQNNNDRYARRGEMLVIADNQPAFVGNQIRFYQDPVMRARTGKTPEKDENTFYNLTHPARQVIRWLQPIKP